MRERIKNILKDKNLWIFSAITLIFFGTFIKMEFATDTYATFSFSKREFMNQFVSSGRFLLVFVGLALKVLNIKPSLVYLGSFLLAIICMVISLYKLNSMIKEDVKNKALQIIIPTLVILNAFSLELFLFVEKGIMIFSVMMNVFAAGQFKKWLENKNKKHLIIALAYMLLANCSYQGVVGLFVVLSTIYIIKYSKNIKEFFINNIVLVFEYAVPATLDYVLIKVFSVSSRVSGNINIVESIKKIAKDSEYMIFKTYDYLPRYFFVAMIAIILLLIIYKIATSKKNNKTLDILKVAYIILAVILVSVAPQIMQNTESIWITPRSTYSYATLFGILVLFLCMNFEIKNNTQLAIISLSIILLIVQFYKFSTITIDRYKVNAIDYEITKKVSMAIDEYEKTTSNKIEKLAIYEDKAMSYSYDKLFVTKDTNVKAYAVDWAIKYAIKYFTGRNLELVEKKNEQIAEEFKKQDWTTFENEQMIFEGDTLHFCRY